MAQYDINLREYWRILNKRKFMVISTAVILGVFTTLFAIIKAPTPLFSTSSSIKFEKQDTVEGLYAKTLSWSSGDDIETQMSVIRSYAVFREVAKRMRLIPQANTAPDLPLDYDIIKTVEDLQSKVTIDREKFTNIIVITVTDTNPAFAQRLANTIAETYRDLHTRQQSKRTREAVKYISQQLDQVREDLRKSEEAFNRFSQKNQILSIDLQSENLLAREQELQDETRTLQEDVRELEGIRNRVRAFLQDPSGSDHNFYSAKAGVQYETTNNKMVELVLKRDTLLQDFTPKHPEVVNISRQIVENVRKLVFLLDLRIKALEERLENYKEEKNDIAAKTNVLMDKKLEYNRLKRKVELQTDMTALLERKHQEAMIRKAESPEEVSIVRPALLPTDPVNPPNTPNMGIMGVVIGLVIGMIIAFIVETFDTSLGAIEDVEETLGAQVLGVVAHGDAKNIQESLKDRYPKGIEEETLVRVIKLVSLFAPKSMMAESFRALRTNIQFKDAQKKIKTIAITSASPKEGKTLVTVNLGLTMAQFGLKTLLIGSDLRKPMLARSFGVEITPGLTDILLGNHPWRDTVKTMTDIIMGRLELDDLMMAPGLDNLHIITSGTIPTNPAELVDSRHLSEFIEEAKKEYDVILFDSPPILSAADAAILGTKVDGVLLVYRVGTVSRGLLKRASAQLEQVNCNLIGIILNGMKPELSPDFHDYKYYKYYYASSEEDLEPKGGRFGRLLSFIKRGTEETKPSAGTGTVKRVRKKPSGKYGPLAPFLILLAACILALGILWQSGYIDLVRWLHLETIFYGIDVKPVPTQNEPAGLLPEKNPPPGAQEKSSGINSSSSEDRKTTPVQKPSRLQKSAKDMEEPTRDKGPVKKSARPKTEKRPDRPAPADKASSALSGEGEKRPFSLRLGAFKTLDRARRAASEYEKQGIPAYWTKVDLGEKGTWFRLYCGHFPTQRSAEAYKTARGLMEAKVKKTEFAILIGRYDRDGQQLQKMIDRLAELHYSPYTIDVQNGGSRLLIGALMTKEGAVRLQDDLKSKGIPTLVIER